MLKLWSLSLILLTFTTTAFSFTISEDSLLFYHKNCDSIYKNNKTKLALYKFNTSFSEDSVYKYLNILKNIDSTKNFAILKLGDYYFSKGSYITASKYYQQLKNNNLFNNETQNKYIKSLIISSQYDKATKEIINLNIQTPLKEYFLALIAYKKNEYDSALSIINKADSFFNNPSNVDKFTYIKFYSLKVEILNSLNNNKDAIRLTRYLIENFPNSIESIRWLSLYPYLDKLQQQSKLNKNNSNNNKTKIYQPKNKSKRKYWVYQFASFQNRENANKYIIYLKSKYPKYSFYIREKTKNNKKFYSITTIKYSSKSKLVKYYHNDLKKHINEKMVLTSISD